MHPWVYSTLAGIDTVVNGKSAGWSTVIFRPSKAAMLHLGSAAATIATRFGNASISWEVVSSSRLELNVTVPAGSSGEIHIAQLPNFGGREMTLFDGENAVWRAGKFVPGAKAIHNASLATSKWTGMQRVVLTVGSGYFPIRAMSALSL